MAGSDDILSLAPPKADLRVAYGGDANQFVDWRMPKTKGPYAVAICIHGGTGARNTIWNTSVMCARRWRQRAWRRRMWNTGAWEIRVEDGRGRSLTFGGVSVFVAERGAV